MKITSQQKKLWLPLSMLLVLFCMYIKALGAIWAVVLVIPMIGCLMVFLICNGDRMLAAIKAWLERDGWR